MAEARTYMTKLRRKALAIAKRPADHSYQVRQDAWRELRDQLHGGRHAAPISTWPKLRAGMQALQDFENDKRAADMALIDAGRVAEVRG